jgi:hypothetical protein
VKPGNVLLDGGPEGRRLGAGAARLGVHSHRNGADTVVLGAGTVAQRVRRH